MRTSEADRDFVAERLRDATVEGRLLAGELDARLGLALSARTYGELVPLLEDLPGPPVRNVQTSRRVTMALALALTVIVATLAAIAWHRW
jgi:hypothetical protein